MALVPIKILVAATTTTPGTAQPVNSWCEVAQTIFSTTGDYNAGGEVVATCEWSESSSGPWQTLQSSSFNPADASVQKNNHETAEYFIGYVRGKLSATPSSGSISGNVYVKVRNAA